NRPGENATGVTLIATDLEAKWLQLLHEIVPNTDVIAAVVFNNSRAESQAREIEEAGRVLGLRVYVFYVGSERDLDVAFASASERRAGALFVALAPDTASALERAVLEGVRRNTDQSSDLFAAHAAAYGTTTSRALSKRTFASGLISAAAASGAEPERPVVGSNTSEGRAVGPTPSRCTASVASNSNRPASPV